MNLEKIKIGLISDIHEDIEALNRYLKYIETNDINIGICLGDSVSRYCDDDTNYFWKKSLQISKPIYYTIGNHDVGIDDYKSIDSLQIYNTYIYPMLSNKYLEEKNFNNKSCYYHKDFDTYKIRIISIFEYEGTRNCDKTIGFEHRRYISSEQLNWFASTLDNTPKDYQVIVLLHQIPDINPIYKQCSFCSDVTKTNLKKDLTNGYGYLQLSIIGNPIGDIINAFQHSLKIEKEYNVREEYKEYLVNPKINYDFSKRNNGKLICILTGHLHCSFITYSKDYDDQLVITVPSATTKEFERQNDDIKPLSYSDNNFYVLTIDTQKRIVSIEKIGNTKTVEGNIRDKIDLSY